MNGFLGALGEVYAARYLRERGYTILSANYRTRFGEIDIVAKKDETMIFTEVKTRGRGMIAQPMESVDRRKQRRLSLAAAQYLKREPPDTATRFDVIEVFLDERQQPIRIRQITNAFDSQ